MISQKSALQDIQTQSNSLGIDLTLVNYHKVKDLKPVYDIIVLDEAHRWITGYPKRSAIWREIARLTPGVPIIFSSGTLTPEGYSGLFNMLALSSFSPWKKFKRFTLWHKKYGKPYKIRINGFDITKYDRTKEQKVLDKVEKFVVPITRKEAGHIHEATDRLVYLPLSKKQDKFYKILKEDLLYEKYHLLADTPVKLLQKLHQISGGFVKTEADLYTFKKNPKLAWLLKNVDPDNTVILANYIAEQKMLAEYFPHTGSITKNAEGVDYSHFKNMVIYSMGFSAATYEQVRARQMNINRTEPIEIIFLLSGIDRLVYKAVQAKKSFTASWYRRNNV